MPRVRYDEFYELMCAEVAGYRVGYGLDLRSTFGPLIDSREHDRARGLVGRAGQAGALVRGLGTPADAAD